MDEHIERLEKYIAEEKEAHRSLVEQGITNSYPSNPEVQVIQALALCKIERHLAALADGLSPKRGEHLDDTSDIDDIGATNE